MAMNVLIESDIDKTFAEQTHLLPCLLALHGKRFCM